VVLYTDGVVDAPSEADGRFGVERLRSVLDAHAGYGPRVLKRALVAALRHHAEGDLSHDDVTIAAIELC
jgi:serine phosphatase RsbU (regulator of sigma subunit)